MVEVNAQDLHHSQHHAIQMSVQDAPAIPNVRMGMSAMEI